MPVTNEEDVQRTVRVWLDVCQRNVSDGGGRGGVSPVVAAEGTSNVRCQVSPAAGGVAREAQAGKGGQDDRGWFWDDGESR